MNLGAKEFCIFITCATLPALLFFFFNTGGGCRGEEEFNMQRKGVSIQPS